MRPRTLSLVGAGVFTIAFAAVAAAQEAKHPGWPSPVADTGSNSLLLLNVLEYQHASDTGGARWDLLGWCGGNERRLWIKSEGEADTPNPQRGEADLQALYGRLITAWFDLQVGGRLAYHFAPGPDAARVYAVVGLQGLAPYRFDIEPSLFVSNKGKVSGRFTATYDMLQTQRLILQPRFETEIAAQEDREFGVARGFNTAEIGFRLRYEIRREFAPYVGASYLYQSGVARERLDPGRPATQWRFAFGARVWH